MSATINQAVLNSADQIRFQARGNNESLSGSLSGKTDRLDIQSSVINEWLKRHSSNDEASMARRDDHVRTMSCMSAWG